jgi:hypothetical protein
VVASIPKNNDGAAIDASRFHQSGCVLEHVPEKWTPVFRQGHAQKSKNLEPLILCMDFVPVLVGVLLRDMHQAQRAKSGAKRASAKTGAPLETQYTA